MKTLLGVKKIAVFRALQLGDMMCAIPAIRALRSDYENAEITLIGLPWAASFVSRFSKYIDRFISFPGYPGLPEQPFDQNRFDRFIKQMQYEEFDLILQMQGNGTIVNSMLLSLPAKYVAGFHNQQSRVHSDLFLEYPDHGSEIERHLLLMNHLGIGTRGKQMEFPLTEEDYREIENLSLPIEKKKYVCVHPGSRGTWRQWPTAYFAALADFCVRKGFKVIVTGTENEKQITSDVIKQSKYPLIDLTGKTTLGAIGALISNAFLLIANCTGVSHIAAALETPSVIISMDGEPQRWEPQNKKIHRMIDWTRNQQIGTVYLEMVALIQELEKEKNLNPSYSSNL
jgi:ADP-heptose:LPS heptosyltransferase